VKRVQTDCKKGRWWADWEAILPGVMLGKLGEILHLRPTIVLAVVDTIERCIYFMFFSFHTHSPPIPRFFVLFTCHIFLFSHLYALTIGMLVAL